MRCPECGGEIEFDGNYDRGIDVYCKNDMCNWWEGIYGTQLWDLIRATIQNAPQELLGSDGRPIQSPEA